MTLDLLPKNILIGNVITVKNLLLPRKYIEKIEIKVTYYRI